MAAQNLTTVMKSGKKTLNLNRDTGYAIIGERINPTGRKVMQEQLKNGDFSMVRRDAVLQLEAGAAILDINAGLPGADEAKLMVDLIDNVVDAADDPIICIDTANIKAMATALEHYCKDGKRPLVNSVTAEKRVMDAVFPIIQQYKVPVIALAGDGVPKTVEDRIKAADALVDEAAKYGIPPEDLIIDCMVLTLGVENKAGVMAFESISKIVGKYGVNITMGASNISFGMPDRPNLTAYFMAMSSLAGLTAPICNPMKGTEVAALQAADLCMGRDAHGMRWIKGSRARAKAAEEAAK